MDLQGKTVHFLGDSITQGCCASCEALGFVERIKQQYGLKEANNYGIGGTRIARQQSPSADPQYDLDFCSRVHQMIPDADIVVVFGGTNDHGHGDAPMGCESDRTADTFIGACHVLFSSLKERFPHAIIAVLTPLHRVGEEDPKGTDGLILRDYADVIRNVAGFYALPVLDLFQNSHLQIQIPEIAAKYTADGLHPNDAGHAILVREIGAFLLSL